MATTRARGLDPSSWAPVHGDGLDWSVSGPAWMVAMEIQTIKHSFDRDWAYVDIAFADEPLHRVTFCGNGKDAMLTVDFPADRRKQLELHILTVTAVEGVRIATFPYDDVSLEIRYEGDELRLRAMRLRLDPDDLVESWQEDLAEWLNSDRRWCLLGFAQDVELTLAAQVPGSAKRH